MAQEAKIVEINPTKFWIESGCMGDRTVMVQHEGCDPFEYAIFGYDHRYTSNRGTMEAAESVARSIGAKSPIENKRRQIPAMPTADEVREQIVELTELLAHLESA